MHWEQGSVMKNDARLSCIGSTGRVTAGVPVFMVLGTEVLGMQTCGAKRSKSLNLAGKALLTPSSLFTALAHADKALLTPSSLFTA
eukprot:1160608-Pelagomonas_calceolata.AAC.11